MPQVPVNDRNAGRMVIVRPVLGSALAALLVCATAAAARAGDDGSDGSNESFLTKFERTLGLRNPNTMEYGINYGERSPLVVPPSRDLPPPEAAAPPPIPDWPKDPDIKKRDAGKVKEKVVPHADYVIDSSRALRPNELDSGGGQPSGGTAATGNGGAQQDNRYTNTNGKKSFFSLDMFKKEEYATFTGEPARTTLTDPPPGYMTPSPDQPYGIGPEKKQVHIETPSEHGEIGR